MIDISKTEVVGFEAAIRGMRNPMNSWEKSDSVFGIDWSEEDNACFGYTLMQIPSDIIEEDDDGLWDGLSDFYVGPNDLKLANKLCKAGTEHSKFRRMIIVTCDITAPLYWWKEYDTYKVGTVANSCSTMHKIASKEFTIDDFSHEHLIRFDDSLTNDDMNDPDVFNEYCGMDIYVMELNGTILKSDFAFSPEGVLENTVSMLNRARKLYLETKDKKYWWQMIQLLPSSYNQKRTVMLNYEVLAKIYRERKNHKLDEWHSFCDWIKTLPYAKEVITLED